MQQSLGGGVELQLLDDGLVLLALNININNVHMGRIDHLAQLHERSGKRKSLGQTFLVLFLTIQIAGHHTLLAHQLCSLLASGLALLAID